MEQVDAYKHNVGKEPERLPDDHPDAWQWSYKGTKGEREQLPELLGWVDETPAALIEGQASLDFVNGDSEKAA